MNEFIELPLCDVDNNFFSYTIFKKKAILDLVTEHYLHIPLWKKICNNGLIYSDKYTVWFEYKEKFSSRIMSVTYEGVVEINQRGKTIFSEEGIHRGTIYRIKEIMSLSEEVERIVNDYIIISEYEGFERIYHPVRRESFDQRDNVVKIIILFCLICGGLSAKQLIHIFNIIQEFEMSSELSYVAFQKADLLKEKEKCLSIMVNNLRDNVKGYTLKDIIYLFELGEFPLEYEKNIYRVIQNCFQVNIRELEKYRYIIKKEYINV